MSLWTCIACSARRAVGALLCPQCGAAGHEESDTVSGPEGGQGQRHVPEAYADPAPETSAAAEAVTPPPTAGPSPEAAPAEADPVPADDPPAATP